MFLYVTPMLFIAKLEFRPKYQNIIHSYYSYYKKSRFSFHLRIYKSFYKINFTLINIKKTILKYLEKLTEKLIQISKKTENIIT